MARTTPPTDPPAAADDAPDAETPPTEAPAASAAPASDNAFFAWLRGIGLPRRAGWIGGVCAGIGERLGIDPLIVRGIVVVIAVLGGPAALLYAAAWLLLPGPDGTIHAQELGRGRVPNAIPGIVAVFLLSFLPLAQGFWFAGAWYWGDLGWFGAVARVVWTGALIAGAVVLIVWLARRAAADPTVVPATTDDRPDTVPSLPADAARAATVSAPTAAADPGERPAPAADATPEDLAAWKRSQEEWKRERAAWVAEQKRTERDRRQAEAQAAAVAAADAARERARIRRLTRPRASAGAVFLVLGLALVAGAIAAFVASGDRQSAGAEWIVGAAVLTLVLGLGTIVVALARRRSGALAFFSILGVVSLVTAVVMPADRTVLSPGAHWSLSTDESGDYAQLMGSTYVSVVDRPDEFTAPVIDLWQLSGTMQLDLAADATVRVEITTDSEWLPFLVSEHVGDGGISTSYAVRDGRLDVTFGDGEPDAVLRMWLGRNAWFGIDVRELAEGDRITVDPALEPEQQDSWGGVPIPATPDPTSTPKARTTSGTGAAR